MKEQPARYRIPRVAKWCDSRFGESAPAASFPLVDERELDMQRDIRDPKYIGAALLHERARHPQDSITKMADRVLNVPIPNYGESKEAYIARTNDTLGRHRLAPSHG